MTNLNDLEDLIAQQAINTFEVKWDNTFEKPELRQAFNDVKNTEEFKDFREMMINEYQKNITRNVLNNLQGLKDLIKEAGE